MNELPKRILIAEDSALIAFMLEETVNDMGHTAVGPAYNITEAMDFLKNFEIDFAILDLDLSGDSGTVIAEELLKRGKPWIFVTGLVSDVLNGAHAGVPFIAKPFTVEAITTAVTGMVQGHDPLDQRRGESSISSLAPVPSALGPSASSASPGAV